MSAFLIIVQTMVHLLLKSHLGFGAIRLTLLRLYNIDFLFMTADGSDILWQNRFWIYKGQYF